MSLRIGIDIGSTTVKVVVLDEQNKLLFRSYEVEQPVGDTPAPPAWGWPRLPAWTSSRKCTPPPPR